MIKCLQILNSRLFLSAALFSVLLQPIFSSSVSAQTTSLYGAAPVTVEGPRGLFLNPSAETLSQGTLAASICGTSLKSGDDNISTYGQSISFGATEWLEIGALGLQVSPDANSDLGSYGPQARARLLSEKEDFATLSLGGYAYYGSDAVEYQAAFLTASKTFELDQECGCMFKSFTLHLGARSNWYDSDVGEDGTVAYYAFEVGLPKNLVLIGESSTKGDLYDKVPWSAGLQAKDPNGLAFTLALIQPGFADDPAIFIGVGINFM